MAYPLRSQPSTPRRCQPCHDQPHHDDTGLTLIEVVVAMALFLILLTSSMSVLLVALKTTAVNRDRVAAANLAGRELEIVRDQFTRGPETVKLNQVTNENPLTGGPQSPVVLDNIHYTVVRTAQWSAVGAAAAAASACDNGTYEELAYLRVNVKVYWDRMSGNPISMDTILTPPKGTYSSSSTGHIGVKVLDAAKKGAPGHTVTIVGPSGTFTGISAADGCTIFPFLAIGPYRVTVNDNNYVNLSADPLTATVLAGAMSRVFIDYDKSASILVTFTTLTGHNPPTDKDIPVSFGNGSLLLGAIDKPGTLDGLFTDLWPFQSGYQLWAGDCLDADPYPDRNVAVQSLPGITTPANVDLAPVHITGPNGATVRAIHGPDNSCPSGDIINLGVIAGGKLDTSAPYGKWTLTTQTTGTRSGDPVVTLLRSVPPAPTNAAVS
jgi:prepilin-type N-terminal cleavage/methylation domain-containing protein